MKYLLFFMFLFSLSCAVNPVLISTLDANVLSTGDEVFASVIVSNGTDNSTAFNSSVIKIGKSFSMAESCPNSCPTLQSQKGYPDCRCYCTLSCDVDKVQDENCICHDGVVSEYFVPDDIGLYSNLSYRLKFLDLSDSEVISGANCRIQTYYGTAPIERIENLKTQGNGILQGTVYLDNKYQINTNYTFKASCGGISYTDYFVVTSERHSTNVINASLFAFDNSAFFGFALFMIMFIGAMIYVFYRR